MSPSTAMRVRDPAEAGRWLRGVLARDAELAIDSRLVGTGDGFVAIPGGRHDGRDHVAQAVARGAAAVAYDPVGDVHPASDRPSLAVDDLRSHAGIVAAEFYGRPSSRLRVVAVTGTNGKTSCSQWIARGLAPAGRPAAVVGTLGAAVVGGASDEPVDAPALTTPDAVALQRLLATFVRRSVDVVAIEASSIGLVQQRLAGTDIEVAVYTQVSRDHLDYHGDMASYVAAKRQLFEAGARRAVVNGNDPHGGEMLAAFGDPAAAIVYGESPLAVPAGARRLEATRVVEHGEGLALSIDGDWGRFDVELGLLGRYNAANALAVAGAWLALGAAIEDVARALAGLVPVPGRMQALHADAAPLVVVDYAHTPDAVAQALAALRPVARARGGVLACVLGAGGDRDPGKRPLMGRAASAGADRVVVTSDNPRSEAPESIARAIVDGLERDPWFVELDRRVAIERAIVDSDAADVVLVAGKGHERWQEIGDRRLPFSDVDVATAALRRRGGAA